MNTTTETVNTAELNSTKSVAIEGVSDGGAIVAADVQASEVSASSFDPRSVAADQLTAMLREANAFFRDEQAKIASRDEASAKFAAHMVKLGSKYHCDVDFRLALDAECASKGIPLPALPGSTKALDDANSGKAPMNEFLPVVKLVDGEWGDKVDRRGKQVKDYKGDVVQVWYHNRSLEKYAPFIEFCVRNGFSGEDIYKILLKGGHFNVDGVEVKATVTAIINFNAKQKGAQSRTPTVWTSEVKAAAARVPALFAVDLTVVQRSVLLEGEKPLFTPSEDGYAAAIIRFTETGLQILGDFKVVGNPLLEKVKAQTGDMTRRNAEFLKSEEGNS